MVLSKVSFTASNVKELLVFFVMVKQTPSTETLSPIFLSFEKLNLANCRSRRVFPKNVPKPVPVLSISFFDLDFIYGSPKIS